ncbi:MAG: glycosyltransferase family 2 protein [Candidatus Moranbacteria bacterium]|nr:glycosyltransferase family 2 protein [Candidatus Moranbacteria bacterium]
MEKILPKNPRRLVELSIIVASFRNAAMLELCLKSIGEEARRLKKKKIRNEIIIVDSQADEKTRDIAKKFILNGNSACYYPFRKNVGFAKLINQGIKLSHGKFLLFLNADIIIIKDAFRKMMEYLKDNPQVGILGPRLLNFDGSPQPSAFHFYTPSIILYRRTPLGKTPWGRKKLQEFVIDLSQSQKPVSIDGWLMGSVLMLRRDNLEKVGPMDERYFMYFEDVDWCRRFKEAGYEIIYFPQAELFHYHGKQSATRHFWEAILNPMTLIHIKSALKYFWKFRKK